MIMEMFTNIYQMFTNVYQNITLGHSSLLIMEMFTKAARIESQHDYDN